MGRTYTKDEILTALSIVLDGMDKVVRLKKERPRCVRCNSARKIVRHHITYQPEKIVVICHNCHLKITWINTVAAIATGVTLKGSPETANIIRQKLWTWFLAFRGVVTEDHVFQVLGINYALSSQQLLYCLESQNRMRK